LTYINQHEWVVVEKKEKEKESTYLMRLLDTHYVLNYPF